MLLVGLFVQEDTIAEQHNGQEGLSTESLDGFFSDNYFDLLPGQKKTLTFTPTTQAETLTLDMNIMTIRDSYEN